MMFPPVSPGVKGLLRSTLRKQLLAPSLLVPHSPIPQAFRRGKDLKN